MNLIYTCWSISLVFLFTVILYLQLMYMSTVHLNIPDRQHWSIDALDTTKPIVLWIIHGYPPGLNAGSEFMAHSMNVHLVKQGYTVIVACPRYPQVMFEGVHLMDLRRIKQIASRANVIMSHHDKVHMACVIGRQYGIPVVELVHNTIRPMRYGATHMQPLRIYNSEWLRNYYGPGVGVGPAPIVRPPVDYREYETPDGRRRYVTLINVNEEKGGAILVELARRMPDVNFLGIRGGYGKQVIAAPCPSNLRYELNTLDIQDVYARTKILIMPSKIETWGRTAVEAMSSGIPVVANTTEGLVESLGPAGVFCARDDLNAWITTIRSLLTDADMYKKVSTTCRARAVELDPVGDLDTFERYIRGIVRTRENFGVRE
jgi:glycosyltransferase involved in cell wall biosynthesis